MNKHYILAAITIISAIAAQASEIQPDTLIKVTDVREVIITESPRGVNYSVHGTETDSATTIYYTQLYTPDAHVRTHQSRDFHFTASAGIGCSRWDIFLSGLGLGMVSAPGAPGDMQLEMGKSFEINWLYALGLRYRTTWDANISIGIGFVWRNYRSTIATRRMVTGDNNIDFLPWEDDATARHTAIKTFAIQFPLIYKQHTPINILGSKLYCAAGAILGASTYASVKNGWTDAQGQKVRECYHGVGQRKFTVDLIAIAGTGYISAYIRYSPQNVLIGQASPQFKSLTAGLMFFF